MDGGAQGRAAARPLLPRRVHVAGADRGHRLPEQGRHLRSLVQGFVADNADDCGRSQAPRRQDRLHVGAPHLGLRDDASPARAHDRTGWRDIARRHTLDRLPSQLPLAGEVLSRMFRRLMLEMLVAANDADRLQFFGDHAHLADKAAFKAYLAPLHRTKWFVYSKRPFAGPEQVLAYLSRYTHRVAISNSRLIAADETGVTFRYKDYRIEGPGRYKTMTLKTGEFIRRFLVHVLPKGFHRIRHYGLFASGARADNIARARELLAVPMPETEAHDAAGANATEPPTFSHPCPCCGSRMSIVETFNRGSTPRYRPPPPTAIRIDTS